MDTLTYMLIASPIDLNIAKYLVNDVHQCGGDFRWEHTEKVPEGAWAITVREELRAVDGVLYVASPTALMSPELTYTLPLLLEECVPVYGFWIAGDSWEEVAPESLWTARHWDARGTKYGPAVTDFVDTVMHRAFLPQSLAAIGFRSETINGNEVIVPPLVTIPAGPFVFGSNPQQDPLAKLEEQPQQIIDLPTFYIMQFPLTTAEYACFVRSTLHVYPERASPRWLYQLTHRLDHKVVNVSWEDLIAYADWLSEMTGDLWRLPSEAEWEKAARGPHGQIYPWGNTWEHGRATEVRQTVPVGSFPSGASPYGVQDLICGSFDWTSSIFAPYPYRWSDGREDPGKASKRVVRGSPYGSEPESARVARRVGWDQNRSLFTFGGRLCRSSAPLLTSDG